MDSNGKTTNQHISTARAGGTSTDVTIVLQFKNLLDSIWTGWSPPVTTIQPENKVYS
jgi:hypothetical protein